MFIFVEDDSNNPLNTSVNMYIFPKNTKFVLCAILISVLYLFVTISSSIRYIDNKVEESVIDIREKLTYLQEGNGQTNYTYYDAIKNMPRPNISLHIPMIRADIPRPSGDYFYRDRDERIYNRFKDIVELYWIVPNNDNNALVSVKEIPWILEKNWVSGNEYHGWKFRKSHIYPIAIGFKNYSANKQKDAAQALYKVYDKDFMNLCCEYSESFNNYYSSYRYGSSALFTPSSMQNRYHSTQAYRGHPEVYRYEDRLSEQDCSTPIDSLFIDYLYFNSGEDPDPFRFFIRCDCGDCVVYLQNTYHTHYTIHRLIGKIEEDKVIAICASVLSWIILLFITIGIYKKFRQKEIAKIQKPLYERLYDACNPKLFLKPYDQQKVLLASDIRKQITLHKDSEDAIHELHIKAKNELGINVLDNHRLDQLEKLVNPSHFMQQGNEQNFLLANELYAKLKNREALLYNDYLMIEQEVTRLYQSTE